MAYWDWMPEFQDVWDSAPADLSALSEEERAMAEYMFEEGFMTYHGEAPSIDTQYARETYFELLGISAEQFDWQGWREAMGY